MQNSYQHDSSFNESFHVSGRTSTPKLSPLYPKTGITKTRRSSRASKKVPTTLLTTDATNFRALVQQFTGCHSGSPTIGPHKGPINLNFEQYSNYNSEKPEARSTWSMNEELEQSFVSFRANDVATTTTTTFSDHNRELFVSGSDHNSRPDPLVFDEFDIDNFSLQEIMMSGGGDYSGTSTTTEDHDHLWGSY